MTEVLDQALGTAVGLPSPEPVPASYDYAFRYRWQQEALKAWHLNGRKGVIEAVTGAGKARVGVAAAFDALRQGIKVPVVGDCPGFR